MIGLASPARGWTLVDAALRALLPVAPPGIGQKLGRWLVTHVPL